MITGKEKIKSFFLQAGYPFFKVYKIGTIQSGNPVYESGEDENLTTGDSYNKFEQWLTLQSAGRFTLVLSEKANAKRGKLMQDFELSYAEATPIAAPAVLAGPPAADPAAVAAEAQRIASEMFDKKMLQWELEQAKAKIIQLEKDLKDAPTEKGPLDKILEVAGPHLGSLIPQLLGKPPAPLVGKVENMNVPLKGVAGVEEMEPAVIVVDNGDDSEETGIVTRFCATLQKHDPTEWLQTIQRITNKIEADPGSIATIKMFI